MIQFPSLAVVILGKAQSKIYISSNYKIIFEFLAIASLRNLQKKLEIKSLLRDYGI
jgi:hypothetical protein